jgi:putative glutamine amidotransferase
MLHYVEDGIAQWLQSRDALLFVLPLSERAVDYAQTLDGLVLQGGADISPRAYGEEPQKPEWAGDETRDRYEIELVRAFAGAGKPVLGICRGAQLINVALGGTLHQDVPAHRSDDYDLHAHEVRLEPGSGLARLYGETGPRRVVSIHHQAIKLLGRGLQVEAHSEPDGLIEAVRGDGPGYVCAVQWHPEFHGGREGFLDGGPLLDEFLQAARK